VLLRKFLFLTVTAFCGLTALVSVSAQQAQEKQDRKSEKKQTALDGKNQNYTAEQVAETVLFAYGGAGGRNTLSQIRKTEIETGRSTRIAADGKPEDSTYEKRIMRGESQEKDRVRINQKLPQAEYALIYDAAKTFGIINNATFTPREEADRNFQAQIFHGLDALLRYKENGSTLKLIGKNKNMNVEYYVLDVTDKQNRTTRFNISAKFFRVHSLEYSLALTEGGTPVKFVRKFYDYRGAQGTLVPYRSVLQADGKQIEETNILTVTFGTKIDENQFQAE
jgi:hypothetical protein